jgi:queuine tRNA-ribosyltransferase
MSKALNFEVLVECNKTRARLGKVALKSFSELSDSPFVSIETPTFMPVGTNGTLKGVTPKQIEDTGCRLMLSNTYHLGCRPGVDVIEKCGGIHSFMRWKNAILTDSGGFQMVSLSRLTQVSENGVIFRSPYNPDLEMNLTPELATEMQHKIGSNIMMQLDDVVHSTTPEAQRVEQAFYRSIRWFDRCLNYHNKEEKQTKQNLFPIIQGGLDAQFRRISAKEIVERNPIGIAIGGLSGGEEKDKFIEMVSVSTESLPADKPRYLMGVGMALDMLMCVAFGCDLFDCVFPTRTARFGSALIGYGKQISLKNQSFAQDFSPICDECDCKTCQNYTRSYIHYLMRHKNTVGCHLLTQHNTRFQMRFMQKIRNAIKEQKFEEFIAENLKYHFESKDNYPKWICDAIHILNLNI